VVASSIPAERGTGARQTRRRAPIGAAGGLVLPAVVVLALLTLYPFAYMVWISLHQWPIVPTLPRPFVGADQFRFILASAEFWRSLAATSIYMAASVSIQMVLGLALALLLATPHWSVRLFQLPLLVPVFISPVVVGLIWKFMLGYDLGIVNHLFRSLGLPALNWLGEQGMAMVSLVMVDVWQWTPFTVLILRAGLDSLPTEPFEAAEIDGARAWQRFLYLTLPMLAPVITVALLFRVLDAFKQFDIVYILTRGGPGDATTVLGYQIWFKGFFSNQLGYAAALSLLMILLMSVLASLLFALMRREGEE
jgi:multiple sugar transport system permease protein